jgi:hypothetical protein
MSTAADKLKRFEGAVLLPALGEVASAGALLRDYEAEVVTRRPSAAPAAEQLLAALEGALKGRRPGPSLILSAHERPDLPLTAGRYVVTCFYQVDGDEVSASPAVVCWMRFNGKLHVFDHRYDDARARMPVEEIQRSHVLNHILRSFDFYKLHAYAATPFPGYGPRT